MSRHDWDPERYLAYADERGRPFVDLTNRVGAVAPRRVVDLGCGSGQLTRILADRWPDAEVHGLDSSPEMIAHANDEGAEAVRFEVADLREWRSVEPVDVLVSNATLQWVPGHLELLPDMVDQVAPGGWFAFQVPGNFGEPSHVLLRELGAESRFSRHLGDSRPESHAPQTYLESLAALGCRVDAWETTYLHVLSGEDPVFRWISGSGARPTLQALPDGLRSEFEEEYKRLLRRAYPARRHGTVLPFRRVFVVAQMPA
ncbi:MAG TPA: trans-aconitate 2-methyltransferase [Nocardioidaceae bacterium]|nr:trans-aconitate 2-methyltransferase [Nocardioidaceae bacterium]